MPRPRRLIVNADDFGLSPEVNAAVIDAHRRGILTSATLLANAPHFDEAVRLAKETPSLGVGVHLNIVRGVPLSPPETIPLLVDESGHLRRFRVRRLNDAVLRQAEREYQAQLQKVHDAGLSPTHIDFEKHHAWQGPLYALACRLAAGFGIPAARTLSEPVAWTVRTVGWPGVSAVVMAAFLRGGFQLGGGGEFSGLSRPDRLLGQCHIGGMTTTVWLRLLAMLPPGVSEVMVHPGLPERSSGPSVMGDSWLSGKREREHAALCAPEVRAALEEGKISLISFRDIADAAHTKAVI